MQIAWIWGETMVDLASDLFIQFGPDPDLVLTWNVFSFLFFINLVLALTEKMDPA